MCWTIFNEAAWSQETSSSAHVLGAFVYFVHPSTAKKHSNASSKFKGLVGWDSKLEPPFARPRLDVQGDEARPGRQPDKHGKQWSAGAKWAAQRKEHRAAKKKEGINQARTGHSSGFGKGGLVQEAENADAASTGHDSVSSKGGSSKGSSKGRPGKGDSSKGRPGKGDSSKSGVRKGGGFMSWKGAGSNRQRGA